jgi:hypothetical protein
VSLREFVSLQILWRTVLHFIWRDSSEEYVPLTPAVATRAQAMKLEIGAGCTSDCALSSLKTVKYTPNTLQTFTPDIVQIEVESVHFYAAARIFAPR